MKAIVALLPPAIVLVVVIGLRASGLIAAVGAAVASLAMWGAGIFVPASWQQLANAAADAGVLTVLVAAMIVPGIVFVEAGRRRKSPEAIAALVDCFVMSAPLSAVAIAIGIGVAVESLTGMGVSLLITVPLLARFLPPHRILAVALVGMSMMPFGALSISAHVGSKLSGVPLDVLSAAIVEVAVLPALALPLVVLALVAGPSLRDAVLGVLCGVALAAGIAIATHWIGIEVAGVLGGLAVLVLLAGVAERRSGWRSAALAPGLRPYLALLAAVALQKAMAGPLAAAGISPALSTGRVSFVALTSPGVALLLATAATAAREVTPTLLTGVARRAWRPVLAIAIFMLAARLMVECGAIATLAGALSGLGLDGATIMVALLGAVGGFATGSGVTGNALFMPSAAAVGAGFGHVEIFAALQNMTSGHVAMASLPVLTILLAASPHRHAADEASAMRAGLAIAAWNVGLATVAAAMLMRLAS